MLKIYYFLLINIALSVNIFCQPNAELSNIRLKLSNLNGTSNFSSSIITKQRDNNKLEYPFLRNNISRLSNKEFNSSDDVNPDVIYPKYPLWISITEVVGLHTGVCLFSNYVLHNDFAKISFKSVEQNFKTGFVWDPDYFVTNYFAHPYNGSIYYNAARANGYNYWVSSALTLGGSLTWELFMETEPPAINDVINTTFSGIFLGEVTHRISSLLIDDSKTGFERVIREIGIGIINITRGVNRLLQGKSWQVNKNRYIREPMALNAYYGVNWNNYGTDIGTGIANGTAGFGLIYGDPFKTKKREIMDFFRMSGNINFGAGQPLVGSLEGYGLLYGKSNKSSVKTDRLSGILHHYDYYENKAYQIGSVSFGYGWFNKFNASKKSFLLYSVNLNLMPLGASKSIYIDTVERTYNFSGGANAKFELSFNFNWGSFYTGYNFMWYHTYVGASGDEFYGILRPKLVVNITKNLGIGAQFLFAHKKGYYKEYESIDGRAYQGMLLLQYKFGDVAF